MSDMTDWQTKPQDGLEAAILDFKLEFPGWWYSVCECQVSCDATIAPTTESEDIKFIDPREAAYGGEGCPFNEGFSVDLPQPSTLADALRHVMRMAREAKRAKK